jgi:hypothetical protein
MCIYYSLSTCRQLVHQPRVKIRPITSHWHPLPLLISDLYETWALLTSHVDKVHAFEGEFAYHDAIKLQFTSTITPLATTNRTLFQPYLPPLLGFLQSLVLPNADPGPIPTIAKQFPTSGSFTFTPPGSSKLTIGDDADDNGMAGKT